MSSENPTTPKDRTTTTSPVEHWDTLQARAGTQPNVAERVDAPQVEPEGTKEERRRSLSRRARFAVTAVLGAFAVALALVLVSALVGAGSTRPLPQSAPGVAHTKAPRTDGRSSSRTRWMSEPEESAPPPHASPRATAPRARRHARPRPDSVAPVPPEPSAPNSPPPSGAAPPESPPEPGTPAPAAPSEPKEKPGLRDGATESIEFGL